MKRNRLAVVVAVAPLWASAAGGAASVDGHRTEPVLVELFTSQSCSSCPPAEALFREIARRDDVVALEWHVDYWDDLSAGASGRWKDPFSSPSHTARQRAYNRALRGTASVYTPQAVVGGERETVGSRAREINALIDDAKREPAPARLALGGGKFQIGEVPEGSLARFVSFHRAARTDVGGGENHRARLVEANVVYSIGRAVPVQSGDALAPPSLPEDRGCALVVEDAETGLAIAARYCP